VTSDKSTERIKTFLADQVARELYIAALMEQAAERFDLVLFDLAPGSDIVHVGSLVASDYLLIPSQMNFLSLDGVVELLSTVRSLARIPNVAPPRLIGVLPTIYERKPNDVEDNRVELTSLVGAEQVLPPIPKDIHVAEAAARGLTLFEYAPKTAAIVGYPAVSGARNSLGGLGGYQHLGEIVDRFVG
jgi:chromosome partitioning protein